MSTAKKGMSEKWDKWEVPEETYITVSLLLEAIDKTMDMSDPSILADIRKGLDNQGWHSSHLVLRTPGHLLITPVKIGDHWSSLQMRQAT